MKLNLPINKIILRPVTASRGDTVIVSQISLALVAQLLKERWISFGQGYLSNQASRKPDPSMLPLFIDSSHLRLRQPSFRRNMSIFAARLLMNAESSNQWLDWSLRFDELPVLSVGEEIVVDLTTHLLPLSSTGSMHLACSIIDAWKSDIEQIPEQLRVDGRRMDRSEIVALLNRREQRMLDLYLRLQITS